MLLCVDPSSRGTGWMCDGWAAFLRSSLWIEVGDEKRTRESHFHYHPLYQRVQGRAGVPKHTEKQSGEGLTFTMSSATRLAENVFFFE